MNLLLGCAIEVGMNFTILNESILLDHLSELLLVYEEVVLPMNFSRPWRSGGIRDTETEKVRVLSDQLLYQSALKNSANRVLPFQLLMDQQ
jgi:hypothetical protein